MPTARLNTSNPDDPITAIVQEGAARQLWPEYGTQPRVLYLGPVNQEA